MVPKDIQRVLRQLSVLSDEWAASDNIAPIERDLALDKLRTLYEALRLADVIETELPATEEVLESVRFDLDEVLSVDVLKADEDSLPEVECVSIPEAKMEVDIEVEAEPEMETAFEAETAVAVVIETEPETEIEIELAELSASFDRTEPERSPFEELTIEPVQSEFAQPEKPQRAATAKSPEIPVPTLFGTDEVDGMFRHRQKQRVLMSLYDIDEPHPASPTSEIETENRTEFDSAPQPVNRPAENHVSSVYEPASEEDELVMEEIEIGGEEQSWKDEVSEPEEEEFSVAPRAELSVERETVLGDVMNHHVQTLGDTLGAQGRTASEAVHGERIGDLRKAIGINDRFLMIRDLFAGDAEAFDLLIGEINAFDDLDDCMIHLAENYAWNPNSDGAKLLMELITRKLA